MPLGLREQLIAFLLAVIIATSAGNKAGAFSMDKNHNAGEPPKSEVPQLKAPEADSNLPSIKLGETIQLVEMGPIIINTDGTTRRIENWDTLTKHEQEVSWRRISKRNEQRRKVLLEKQQQEHSQQETATKEDL